MDKNITWFHVHTELSLLDSTTNYKDYIHRAKELGHTSICFTEHGNTYDWVDKKMYCESTQYKVYGGSLKSPIYVEKNGLDKILSGISDVSVLELKPIKYIHGVEIYLTETLDENIRDNYHSILIAKTYPEGFKEVNSLIDLSTQKDHVHYKPRLTFDEFLNISDNVIKISACLASPLNKLIKLKEELAKNENLNEEAASRVNRINNYYSRLIYAYDYYEIQPHTNCKEQIEYNSHLYELSKITNKPLIAGTDTHSLDGYKAECRTMLQYSKGMLFSNEDDFDLTCKSYEEVLDMFRLQGSLDKEVYELAVENTNVMADSVDGFELDLSFKYPKLYEDEYCILETRINDMLKTKYNNGHLVSEKYEDYINGIKEELAVFKEIGMIGFILFMSELCCWCWENDIPIGFCRGSVGGSIIAFITDITDVDPIRWNTVFSRFANKDRKEIGDIDLDFAPSDRCKVYEYIIDRFGIEYTSYILVTGTMGDKAAIDGIVRGFRNKWMLDNGYSLKDKNVKIPYNLSLDFAKKVKEEFSTDKDKCIEKYSDIFYYYKGMVNVVVSKGIHPAGIVVSPTTLNDNYGTFWEDNKRCMSINMDEIHEISLVKYDILGLKNIEIIKDVYRCLGKKYPKSYEIDWSDMKVWDDMIKYAVGIFQFESKFAFDMLQRIKPTEISHISLTNAAIRPSGKIYRDRLASGIINKNPSPLIDELLKGSRGYLAFQEDTSRFLIEICGLSGSEADNIRRAIGRKQVDRLNDALPSILEGYCSKSTQPRHIAEKEAKEFLDIIESSSAYQFGYNHTVGYSMIGYLCAMLRFYHPELFVMAYLNNSDTEEDIVSGELLAKQKEISINGIKFRHSNYKYMISNKVVYRGIGSVKYMNELSCTELYNLRDCKFDDFVDLLWSIKNSTSLNSKQLSILIKINFFDEFGDVNRLLKIVDIFNSVCDRSQFKKSELDKLGISESEMAKLCNKVSEKTYSNVDVGKLIKKIISKIPAIKSITLRELIDYQMEFMGYVDIKDLKYAKMILITGVDTKYSPKLSIYSLSNGKSMMVKINKRSFSRSKLEIGDVIYVDGYETKPQSTFDEATNSYVSVVGTKEMWITKYRKVAI